MENAVKNVAAALFNLFNASATGIYHLSPFLNERGDGWLIWKSGAAGWLEVNADGENVRVAWIGKRGRPMLVKPGQATVSVAKLIPGFIPYEDGEMATEVAA